MTCFHYSINYPTRNTNGANPIPLLWDIQIERTWQDRFIVHDETTVFMIIIVEKKDCAWLNRVFNTGANCNIASTEAPPDGSASAGRWAATHFKISHPD